MLNGPGALRTCGHEGPDRTGGRARTRVDAAAFAEAVLDVTCLIPSGHVLTYGDIAELLGHGGPRQVGRALSRGSRDVPWWRVLRAGGHPAVGLALRARPHYEAEGTALRVPAGAHGAEEYRVDLAAARWWPSEADHATVRTFSSALERFGP